MLEKMKAEQMKAGNPMLRLQQNKKKLGISVLAWDRTRDLKGKQVVAQCYSTSNHCDSEAKTLVIDFGNYT